MTTYPLIRVHMEWAAQLEQYSAELEAKWAPRDQNQEADDLMNGKFGGVGTRLRRASSVEEGPFLVLPALQAEAVKYYVQRKSERAQKGAGGGRSGLDVRKGAWTEEAEAEGGSTLVGLGGVPMVEGARRANQPW